MTKSPPVRSLVRSFVRAAYVSRPEPTLSVILPKLLETKGEKRRYDGSGVTYPLLLQYSLSFQIF